jgi:hypothetical protein
MHTGPDGFEGQKLRLRRRGHGYSQGKSRRECETGHHSIVDGRRDAPGYRTGAAKVFNREAVKI